MDTIGDFLTIIRNASAALNDSCSAQWSRIRESIAKVLLKEGFVSAYNVTEDKKGHKVLNVTLKYVENAPALTQIERYSKPGRRMYYESSKIPKVLGGLGIAILTTSKGIMTDKDARTENVGGELICKAW